MSVASSSWKVPLNGGMFVTLTQHMNFELTTAPIPAISCEPAALPVA